MFTKRIIPCLDVHNGRVVKGVNFVDLVDAGDPVAIAKAYDEAGADEIVFLDITASSDARETVVDMVRKVAANVFIPFTGRNFMADALFVFLCSLSQYQKPTVPLATDETSWKIHIVLLASNSGFLILQYCHELVGKTVWNPSKFLLG